MQNEDPLVFRILLLTVLVLFIAHRAYYTARYPDDEKGVLDQKDEGRLEKVASLFIVIALLTTVIYIFKPSWMRWSSLQAPVLMRWVGLFLATVGLLVLQWSHYALGSHWSDRPQIATDHELIRTGPYRLIRHPIYTSFLFILGSPLLIATNWFLGFAWIAGASMDIVSRINYEEKKLEDHFGDEYRTYRDQTGAILPKC